MTETKERDGAEASAAEGALAHVAGRVRAAIGTGGLTQSAAAAEIGIADSALSQWLRGAYAGDSAAVEAKCLRWLDAREARAELKASLPEPPAWAATPLGLRALSALSHAQLASDMVALHGGAGLGKTAACRRYAALRPNVWVATMSPATRAVGAALDRVCAATGAKPQGRRAAVLEEAAIWRLKGSGGLLVVDECQHLSLEALEAVRALHDASGTGIALVGSNPLWERLSGGRTPGYAQLFSRVGKRVRLARPSSADSSALLAAWGVDGGGGTAEEALEIARTPGALRGLTKALRLAHLVAKGRPVGRGHLAAAWRDLTGEARKNGRREIE